MGFLQFSAWSRLNMVYCHSGLHTPGHDSLGLPVCCHAVRQHSLLRDHHWHLQFTGASKPWCVLLVRANPPNPS